MENKGKAETYIGFAIRAGKYRTGTNTIKTLKRAYVVIVCKTASDNTKKDAFKAAKKLCAPVLVTKTKTLEEMIHRENAKVMAVTDAKLAEAILRESENDFLTLDQEKIYG